MNCPPDEAVVLLLEGKLTDSERAAIEAHADDCAGCRRLLAQCARDGLPGAGGPDDVITRREVNDGERPPRDAAWTALIGDALSPRLARGTSLGRYLILDEVGRGGTGIVYAAYDPELDRKVALKLLHAGATGSAHLRDRMRREAKALARLSHPNVITVYDVGVAGGQLFIAMELIHGATLGGWLTAAPRSIDEIVRQFVAAWRGLEAAHAAGLVHRDLKPANVLVGDHGRVCVSDFGLVRVADEPIATGAPVTGPFAGSMTQTGALLGTPSYMAPEQLEGKPADARSDQFSFCVMLHEALVGERPFRGDTIADLRAAVSSARIAETPRGRRLPPWLRRILVRGLDPAPDRRYPSMTALLRELGRDRAHRRRIALAIAGLGAVLAATIAAASAHGPTFDCHPDDARLRGISDRPTKEAILAAFRATGRTEAEAVWREVERGFDSFTRSWRRGYTEACEATHVRGEQSERVLDLRMDCLRHQLDGAAALAELFTHADGPLLDHAASAVQRAADPGGCADVRALTARIGPPSDPAARGAYDALQRHLAQTSALIDTFIPARLGQSIDTVVDEARRLAHPVLLSDALRIQGQSRWYLGEWEAAVAPLHEAVIAGMRGGDDDRVAWAWDLLAIMLARVGRVDEAERSLAYATAAGDRAGRTPLRLGIHLQAAAAVAQSGDHPNEAAAHYEQAADAYARAGVPVYEAICWMQAGEALSLQWPAVHAIEDCTRGLRRVEAVASTQHPARAQALVCLSELAAAGNHGDEALGHARAAAAALESEYGQDGGPMFAFAHLAIAHAANVAGDPAAALAAVERAGPGGHLGIRRGLVLERAQALIALSRAREALPELEAAHPWLTTHGDRPTQSASSFALARALDATGGDHRRAVKLGEDARALLDREPASPLNLANRRRIDEWLAARGAHPPR